MILISLYIQEEYYSTSILMLAIEIYTYCLLTFTVVFNVLRRGNQKQPIMLLTRAFLVVTVITLLTILIVLILSLTKTFTCARDRGYGTMATIALELVLMGVNFRYSRLFRQMIQESAYQANASPSMAEHFLDEEHKAHKIRIRQILLIRMTFLVSVGLNLAKIGCILGASHPLQCGEDNRFGVDQPIDVAILSLENISQIFPHFMIPLILWYIPANTRQVADTTLYVAHSAASSRHTRTAPRLTPRTSRDASTPAWPTTSGGRTLSGSDCTVPSGRGIEFEWRRVVGDEYINLLRFIPTTMKMKLSLASIHSPTPSHRPSLKR